MTKTLTKICTVALMLMMSMSAMAKVDIKIESFTGGEISATQGDEKDGKVTVTLTVIPYDGYTITKDDIYVYATISPSETRGNSPTISERISLDGKDPDDASEKRDYTFTITTNFGVWVKEANFSPESKGGGTRTVISGVYYFVNCGSGKSGDPKMADITNPDNYFYLVPADNPQQDNKRDAWFSSDGYSTNGDPEKPYLTTYKTKKDAADIPTGVTERPHNSVWIVKFASTDNGTDYYNLIHAATGKYVVYEPPYSNKNNRKSMHLLTTDNPGENAKFAITINADHYNFRPKSIDTGANTNKYLNAAQQNYTAYYSSDKYADGDADYFRGLVGLWKDAGDGSDWQKEATLLDAPTISDVDANSRVTIADVNNLPSGYEIRYTTDGSKEPTASTGTVYSEAIPITASVTIKAVVVRYGMVLTEVASEVREPVSCATPVITFDNITSEVSITCATAGSTIYYTIDGSNPTASSTLYNATFSVTSPTTIKAIATHATLTPSAVAELALSQVVTPTIQNSGSNAISITTDTPGATIYYTTDGTDPTTSSTKYSDPLTENVSNVTIKAIAVKEGMISSTVGSGSVKLQCATPVITRVGQTFTLSCSMPTDAALYYTLRGGSEVAYLGTPVPFDADQLPMTVTAVARHNDYLDSETASMELKNGEGTIDAPYLIYGTTDLTNFVNNVNNGTTVSACYKLVSDVSASGIDEITIGFTGVFDGNGYTISNLGHALFNTVNGGTVKNVILDNVSISGGSNVGAICNEATGNSRIYNCGVLATSSLVEKDQEGYDVITSCSSTISGSGYVGGIVGLLDGSSRVINCFSYANVSGGTHVGGIVGYNNVATTATNLKTMVMNCMFYGEVSGGSIAPIYNGKIITNVDKDKGVSNFNYFRLESSYIQNTDITKVYNCALGAETRFLQRFEFFRHLLNSHRELAAWWATDNVANKDEMMKWVMEPSQIGSSTPYPILKTPGKYPSVMNIDAENATTQSERNKGGKLGTLTVNIQMGDGAVYDHPGNGDTEAKITTPQLTLNITDKDPDHFNFNYYKVQLPYYNDVGTKNYTGNRVVTGWKIVSITGGTPGSFTTGADATVDSDGKITSTPYNFADRNCTNKDLYSVSGRVFNQGAYWDVPEGVSVITIEPYWAKAAYVADAYADIVYNAGMGTAYNVPNVGGGQIYTNNTDYSIAGEQQKVYTTVADAVTALSPDASHTVNDYAVVLVGNVHQYTGKNIAIGGSNKYTVTTIDLDGDNEPDYSFMLRDDGRNNMHPLKWDFLNLVGLGMAQKSTGGTGSYNLGILCPTGWFESTNTALYRVTQFEYEHSSRTSTDALIVQGGVMEQWVSSNQKGTSNRIPYIHVGGNVWFKEFHTGCHQDKSGTNFVATKHSPISVTGGDFNEFYLTGLYVANTSKANYADNAECYINGGRFGVVCGAAQEGIGKDNGADNTGNITWQIQNADISEFYAGGLNAAKPVTGNLSTTIIKSHVGIFCGGPKFGDMSAGKTVTTIATDCTFGTFFGAGYGGNSYSRYAPKNRNNVVNLPGVGENNQNFNSWNDWVYEQYKQEYKGDYGGVSTQINYQFLPMSDNTTNVARLFVEFVKFSLATTKNVTSNLDGCTITGSFYGGGSLGKVDGNVTSTLKDCTVNGSAFGAGFSASLPNVEVDKIGFKIEPYYYEALGTYRIGVKDETTTYTWKKKEGNNWIDKNNHFLYTTEDLAALGTVTGTVTLNIENGTTVMGSVYGGGESSDVVGDASDDFPGNVVVNINGGTINGNVHGGGYGKTTEVGGDVLVNIGSRTGTEGNYTYAPCTAEILGDVYGGSAFGSVNTSTSNTTTVNLFGGTIHGDAYGGGLGQIGRAAQAAVGTEGEEGYVPAVTEIKDVKAQVKGEVSLTLDGTKFEVRSAPDDEGTQIPVSGRIFGCNNLNGSPEGDVNVTIERTIGYNIQRTASGDLTNDEAEHRYELAAVYGGGNLAAYLPNGDPNYKKTTSMAHITINGCEKVSIQQVYGGGNAASTPAAQIDVNGTYEIEEMFGGGNGKDRIQKNGVWMVNPGANMGFTEYKDNQEDTDTPQKRADNYGYGTGKTNVNIYGGRIHRVFGGANTKGNVRQIALTILEDKDRCTFMVDEAYGGGKSASMDGAAELKMACIPGLKAAYGGAQEANIHNNVVLNITNGTYDRVFGGNNKSGTIDGTITVNIEETGCRPVIIGQLYGGGNLAPYTAPDNQPGPTINVKSFTSIGEIFGGGFGATAKVTGDTYVNINEVILSNTETGQAVDYSKKPFVQDVIDEDHPEKKFENVVLSDGTTYRLWYRPADTTNGSIGVIGNVYGGGNEAEVDGSTHVNIGTKLKEQINTLNYLEKDVIGVDIRGNVYGGGNKADVTGSTNVRIGKENSTPSPARETTGGEVTN